MTTISPSVPAQAAIADYLKHGGYDRHLRKLRDTLELQQSAMLAAAARHFPERTRVSKPVGGYFPVVRVRAAGGFVAAVSAGIGSGHQPGAGADIFPDPKFSQLCATQLWDPLG